jgi:O-acetylserine/cysteine efflux transporter
VPLDHTQRGLLFAQLNAVFAAASFVTGQLVTDPRLSQPMHVLAYTALMYLIAVPVNLLWWLVSQRGWLPRLEAPDTGVHIHADRPPRTLRRSRSGYRWLIAQSVFSALALNCMWLGMSQTSAAIGALITRCELLVAVALGMLLLRERFTPKEWLGFGLSLLGVFGLRLTVLHGTQAEAFVYLALGALFWGLTEVTGKVLIRHMPVHTAMPLRAVLMAPMLCAVWWLRAPGLDAVAPSTWAWLVTAALLGPVLSRNCYMLAISYLPVSQVVVLNQTTPLYSAGIEFLLRAVIPGWQTAVGGVAIVLGNMLLVRGRASSKDNAMHRQHS